MSHSESHEKNDKIPVSEWIIAGVGLIVVCLTLVFLLYKAFLVEGGTPKISFKIESVVAQDRGSLVLGTVKNSGGETVTNLQILGSAGAEIREVNIDYIPARSSRKFGIFFSSSVSENEVNLDAGGYQEP